MDVDFLDISIVKILVILEVIYSVDFLEIIFGVLVGELVDGFKEGVVNIYVVNFDVCVIVGCDIEYVGVVGSNYFLVILVDDFVEECK